MELLKKKKLAEPTDDLAALRALRGQIAGAEREVARLQAEAERCRSESHGAVVAQERHAQARAALEGLHAARFAGESVPNERIEGAESALATSAADLTRAEAVAAGALRAAEQFEGKADAAHGELGRLRAQFRKEVHAALGARAIASREAYLREVERFALEHYARHIGEIQALAHVAESIGVTDSLPVTAESAQFVATASRLFAWSATPGGSVRAPDIAQVDVHERIGAAAAELAEEFEDLTI